MSRPYKVTFTYELLQSLKFSFIDISDDTIESMLLRTLGGDGNLQRGAMFWPDGHSSLAGNDFDANSKQPPATGTINPTLTIGNSNNDVHFKQPSGLDVDGSSNSKHGKQLSGLSLTPFNISIFFKTIYQMNPRNQQIMIQISLQRKECLWR